MKKVVLLLAQANECRIVRNRATLRCVSHRQLTMHTTIYKGHISICPIKNLRVEICLG